MAPGYQWNGDPMTVPLSADSVRASNKLRIPPAVRYVGARLLWGVLCLFLLSIVVFGATHLLPGDPVRAALGPQATPERVEFLQHELNLNRPLVDQYTAWLSGAVRGDFGRSTAMLARGSAPEDSAVATLLGPRLANSIALLVLAAAICAPGAIALGCISALSRGGAVDKAMTPAVIVLSAIPEFVLGVLLIVIFATGMFQWLPAVSTLTPGVAPLQQWQSFALPALTLALMVTPYIYRMTRVMMKEVLESDYVVAARLRGVSPVRLVVRHAVPNALGPTVQTLALTATYLAGGAVVVESVFNFPGIGLALVDAVGTRDYPVIQAVCMGLAALYVLLFIAADVVSTALNPKGEWQ